MRGYLARVGQAPRSIKLFLAFTLLANIGFGVFQLIYNLYLVRLGYHEDFIGAFSAVNTLALAVTALVLGPLVNRFGPWVCLLAGTLVLIVASIGQATLASRPLLLVCAALGGLGMAGLIVPNMPFIIEHSSDEDRADMSALTFALLSLSMTAGALVGGRVPGLLTLMSPRFTPESVAIYRGTLLAGVALTALGLAPLLAIGGRRGAVDRAARAGALLDGGHSPRRVRADMAVFVAVGALFSVSAAALVPFYNVYLKDLGASADAIGTVFALSGVSGALLGVAAPALARRFGVLAVAATARFAGVPLILLLVAAPGLPLAFAAQIVRATALSMAWPIDSNLIAEVLPGRQRATVFSLRSAAWNFTWAVGSFAIGRLIVATGGYNVAFVTSSLFAVLALALFSVYFGRHPHVLAQRAARAQASGVRRQASVVGGVGKQVAE